MRCGRAKAADAPAPTFRVCVKAGCGYAGGGMEDEGTGIVLYGRERATAPAKTSSAGPTDAGRPAAAQPVPPAMAKDAGAPRRPSSGVQRPAVKFVLADGRRVEHTVAIGDTVLDCALDNGVAGLLGQCGGACNCSTCHCYVDAPWFAGLPAMIDDECALLEYVWQRRHNSRLACQVRMTAALDGIVVRMPQRQQ